MFGSTHRPAFGDVYQLVDPIHKMPAASPLRESLSCSRKTPPCDTQSDHKTESYIERSELRRNLYACRGPVPDDLILSESQLSRVEPGTGAERAFGGSANIECVYHLEKKVAIKVLRSLLSVKTPYTDFLTVSF